MTKRISFEKLSTEVYRMSIMNFNIDSEEHLFNRIVELILKEKSSIFLFGIRENSFWRSEELISSIRNEITDDFKEHGYYKHLYHIKEKSIFSLAKIDSFELNKIYLLIKFWNYFEVVFILKINDEECISILSGHNNFSFKQYEYALNKELIELSICKPENDILSIDSKNIEIFERLKIII